MGSKEKSMWDKLSADEQQEFWSGMSQSEQIAFARDMKTSVADHCVSPPYIGISARMNKKVLGVAMVAVFCISWWIVAGEAWKTSIEAEQAFSQVAQVAQAEQAQAQAEHALEQAEQASPQVAQAYQARNQARAAYAAAQWSRSVPSGYDGGDPIASAQQAKQALQQAVQANKQAEHALEQARQASPETAQAYQALKQARSAQAQAEQARPQAELSALQVEQAMQVAQAVKVEQAMQVWQKTRNRGSQDRLPSEERARQVSIVASEHFRTQAAWGIGAGLLADVLLLIGAVAWSKLSRPKW